jgi:hypothetical protein
LSPAELLVAKNKLSQDYLNQERKENGLSLRTFRSARSAAFQESEIGSFSALAKRVKVLRDDAEKRMVADVTAAEGPPRRARLEQAAPRAVSRRQVCDCGGSSQHAGPKVQGGGVAD